MEYTLFAQLNGVLYVLIALTSVPVHILVVIAIIKTGSVKKSITLRILLSLAYADIVQLIIQGIAGFSIVIGVELSETSNNLMGSIMAFFWPVTLFQHVTLAFNRLQVVTSKTIFHEEEFKYCDPTIVLSWLIGVVFICGYCIGGIHTLYFDAPNLNWIRRNGTTDIIRALAYIRMMALTAGLFACVAVIVILVINRRNFNGQNNQLLTSKDFQLFIQTTAVFILALTHVGTWNLVSNPSVYLLAILNLEWILVCALLPYLNIVMCSEIRNSLFALLKISKKKKNSLKMTPVKAVTAFTSFKIANRSLPEIK